MDTKKIKYSQWRPIGVCDTAPPGKMKAQMFTREDLDIITAPGIDRHSWKTNAAVKKVLQIYAMKLAKISSTTVGVRRPSITNIRLVGSQMHLDRTPTLNKESQQGKVQLFQIEFCESAAKKKRFWLYSAILLGLFLTLVGGVFVLKELNSTLMQKRHRAVVSPNRSSQGFCEGDSTSSAYREQLDEVRQILARRFKKIAVGSGKNALTSCDPNSLLIGEKEKSFLLCAQRIEKLVGMESFEESELEKIYHCWTRICASERFKSDVNLCGK